MPELSDQESEGEHHLTDAITAANYLKCDETKPDCLSCAKYQVYCKYRGDARDALQACVTGASHALKPAAALSETNAILSNLNQSPKIRQGKSLGSSCLDPVDHFTAHDLQILRKWKWRTMPSLGSSENISLYENVYTRLTFSVGHSARQLSQ